MLLSAISGSWIANTTQKKMQVGCSWKLNSNSCSGDICKQRKVFWSERKFRQKILPLNSLCIPKAGQLSIAACPSQLFLTPGLLLLSPDTLHTPQCSSETPLAAPAPSPKSTHTPALPHPHTSPLLCILSYLPLQDFYPSKGGKAGSIESPKQPLCPWAYQKENCLMQKRNYMAKPQSRRGDRLPSDTDSWLPNRNCWGDADKSSQSGWLYFLLYLPKCAQGNSAKFQWAFEGQKDSPGQHKSCRGSRLFSPGHSCTVAACVHTSGRLTTSWTQHLIGKYSHFTLLLSRRWNSRKNVVIMLITY